MGVDDVPGAGTAQTGEAGPGGIVVQGAGDIHGGIHVGHDPGERVLGRLNPHNDARRLAEMDHDAAADLLAGSPILKAARVIAALLSADYALAVSLLGSIDREIAQELLAAAGTAAGGLEHLPEAAEAIAERTAERNRQGKGKSLGRATGQFRCAAPSERTAEGYYRSYHEGIIHWSGRGGAQATSGAACQHFVSLGGSCSRLGFPLGPEERAAQSQPFGTDGTWQRFEGMADFSDEVCERLGMRCGATLYWSSPSGAHATWGGIGEYYELANGTWGWLGFPVTDAVEVSGPRRRPSGTRTVGWRQGFEGGVVFCTEKTGAIAMSAEAAEYYDDRGEMGADLGFPVGPEIEATESPYGTTGKCQRFEWVEDHPVDILELWADRKAAGGAVVYWSQASGIHAITGGISKLYERLHGTGGWLGFPKSDRAEVSSASIRKGRAQDFEGGSIFWNEKYRAVAVHADVMALFGGQDDLLRQIGFPVGRDSPLAEEEAVRVQCFEHGVVTVRDGTAEVWVRPQVTQSSRQ